ncbi:beta-1,4-endoglucanase [Aphelenchoides avenae]|nr:beta-1,4-endoglucanase [Aphelenchus avenae]
MNGTRPRASPTPATRHLPVRKDFQIYPDETNKWYALLDGNKASYLAWSIADKTEASAALKPGTSPTQVGDDAQVSGSSTFLKKWILSKRLFSCDGALLPVSPSPAPAPVPAPDPPSSGGGVSVSVKSSQKWNSGVADITVTNNVDAPICCVQFAYE